MALFIKANPKVAEHLGLTEVRNRMPDGNYMLWQADMLAFAPIPLILETCKQIGALALQPHEARQEQDGEICRPLPEALDERFRIEQPEEPSEEQAGEQSDGSDLTDETTDAPTSESATRDAVVDTSDEPTEESDAAAAPEPANEEGGEIEV